MTAKQIMDFADKHANDTWNFFFIKEDLTKEKRALLGVLEVNPNDKKASNKIKKVNEKLRMLDIMYNQRLELFEQSKVRI